MPDTDDTTAKDGLERRYDVRRIGGTPGKHDDCRFFVLDPRHDRHARTALLAYADSCEAEYPQLAADARRLVSEAEHQQAADAVERVFGGPPSAWPKGDDRA